MFRVRHRQVETERDRLSHRGSILIADCQEVSDEFDTVAYLRTMVVSGGLVYESPGTAADVAVIAMIRMWWLGVET